MKVLLCHSNTQNIYKTIQATCLHICLRVPYTISIEALHVEYGEIPLYYVDNAQSYLDQQLMFGAFLVRSSGILYHMPLQDGPTEYDSPVPVSSWHLKYLEIYLYLHRLYLKINPSPLLKAIATGYIENTCSKSFNIYTDGFKTVLLLRASWLLF